METHLRIAQLFDLCFTQRYRTRLVGGGPEPLYTPTTKTQPAIIQYRADFPASALHEAAHWCIAGPKRRELVDFGYWYEPPPRNLVRQNAFLDAELNVQALESIFADACGVDFTPSGDNLDGENGEGWTIRFNTMIQRRRVEIRQRVSRSTGGRAALFLQALATLSHKAGTFDGGTPDYG